MEERANPFIGPKAYEEKDHLIFHGREEESLGLYSKVYLGPLTLLFGKSGLGKTSLIQAGLYPQLKSNTFIPFYFRPDYGTQGTGGNFVKELTAQIKNAYKDNYIGFSEPVDNNFDISDVDDLWEFLHAKSYYTLIDGKKVKQKPVIVLDQFEEIFTIGNYNATKGLPSNIHAFICLLGELIENIPPANTGLTEDMRQELFNKYASEGSPVSIIFSFREEYYTDFLGLSKIIPLIKQSNIQRPLGPLGFDKARNIIDKVASDIFEPAAIDKILLILTSTKDIESAKEKDVESFMLSLFCEFEADKWVKSGSKVTVADIDEAEFTSLLAKKIEDAFYPAKGISPGQQEAVPFTPEERTLIEDGLITPEGYRLPLYLNTKEIQKINRTKIQRLIDEKIVRYRPGGLDSIEIIHDKYAAIFKENRDKREQEKELKRIEGEKAEREQELAEKEAARKHEEDLKNEAIAEKEKADQARAEAVKTSKKLTRVSLGLAIASFVLIIATIWAGVATWDARKNADKALSSDKEKAKLIDYINIFGNNLSGFLYAKYGNYLAARSLYQTDSLVNQNPDSLPLLKWFTGFNKVASIYPHFYGSGVSAPDENDTIMAEWDNDNYLINCFHRDKSGYWHYAHTDVGVTSQPVFTPDGRYFAYVDKPFIDTVQQYALKIYYEQRHNLKTPDSPDVVINGDFIDRSTAPVLPLFIKDWKNPGINYCIYLNGRTLKFLKVQGKIPIHLPPINICNIKDVANLQMQTYNLSKLSIIAFQQKDKISLIAFSGNEAHMETYQGLAYRIQGDSLFLSSGIVGYNDSFNITCYKISSFPKNRFDSESSIRVPGHNASDALNNYFNTYYNIYSENHGLSCDLDRGEHTLTLRMGNNFNKVIPDKAILYAKVLDPNTVFVLYYDQLVNTGRFALYTFSKTVKPHYTVRFDTIPKQFKLLYVNKRTTEKKQPLMEFRDAANVGHVVDFVVRPNMFARRYNDSLFVAHNNASAGTGH